jgi:hypothetical protein
MTVRPAHTRFSDVQVTSTRFSHLLVSAADRVFFAGGEHLLSRDLLVWRDGT